MPSFVNASTIMCHAAEAAKRAKRVADKLAPASEAMGTAISILTALSTLWAWMPKSDPLINAALSIWYWCSMQEVREYREAENLPPDISPIQYAMAKRVIEYIDEIRGNVDVHANYYCVMVFGEMNVALPLADDNDFFLSEVYEKMREVRTINRVMIGYFKSITSEVDFADDSSLCSTSTEGSGSSHARSVAPFLQFGSGLVEVPTIPVKVFNSSRNVLGGVTNWTKKKYMKLDDMIPTGKPLDTPKLSGKPVAVVTTYY